MRNNVTLMASKFRQPKLSERSRISAMPCARPAKPNRQPYTSASPAATIAPLAPCSKPSSSFPARTKSTGRIWQGAKPKPPKRASCSPTPILIFVGGGDVEVGIERLHELDLKRDIAAAAERGAVFAAMSAGAIMLGERWIRWPSEHAGDDSAETFECLGIVPFSLDTHGEGDEWQETHSFATVRARETQQEAHAYGIPSGGALLITAGRQSRRHWACRRRFSLPSRAKRRSLGGP